MKKNYSTYRAEELLQDEYFLEWNIYPQSDTDGYWENALKENSYLTQEIKVAQEILASISTDKQELSASEVGDMWNNITDETYKKTKDNSRYSFKTYFSVAASIALFLIGGITVLYLNKPDEKQLAFEEMIQTPNKEQSNDIQLIISGEKQVSIEGKDAELLYDKTGKLTVNSKQIELNTDQTQETKTVTVFNQLIVPKGRRSSIILADGSKIWLNAGSRLIYPKEFEKEKREIYIEGEAYLEVSKDKTRPFFVQTKTMNLKVLGTSFNVSAYDDESAASVTLITGKVKVTCEKKDVVLQPNDHIVYDNNHITVSHVTDVYNYIAWKDGLYYFRSEKLKTVLHKLSRYYKTDIECSPTIGSEICSGKIDLKENIEDVLSGLQNIISFTYEIDNQTIKIKS